MAVNEVWNTDFVSDNLASGKDQLRCVAPHSQRGTVLREGLCSIQKPNSAGISVGFIDSNGPALGHEDIQANKNNELHRSRGSVQILLPSASFAVAPKAGTAPLSNQRLKSDMTSSQQAVLSAFAFTIALCLPAAPAHAAPALDQWGTGASTSTLTCANFSLTCGVGTTPAGFGAEVDNFRILTADSTINDIRGAAEAHAAITGITGLNLPHLTGQSGGPQLAFSSSWGLDAYFYTGVATTRTLSVTLTGTVANPGNSPFTGISASVYVLDPAEVENLGGGFTRFAGYFGEGLFPTQRVDLYIEPDGQLDTGSIVLNLNPGDSFYLWATLSTSSGLGGTAISMNSLSLSVDDNFGLRSASAGQIPPIPEPASWLMLLAGLGALGTAVRRSRHIA